MCRAEAVQAAGEYNPGGGVRKQGGGGAAPPERGSFLQVGVLIQPNQRAKHERQRRYVRRPPVAVKRRAM